MIASSFIRKRRKYKRRELSSAAVIMNGPMPRFEKASEIGEGGMSLRVLEPLRIGEQIEIQLLLPGNRGHQFVTAKCEILYGYARESHIHMGIRFINLDAQTIDCIRKYVSEEL